jgi:hypothetical protein
LLPVVGLTDSDSAGLRRNTELPTLPEMPLAGPADHAPMRALETGRDLPSREASSNSSRVSSSHAVTDASARPDPTGASPAWRLRAALGQASITLREYEAPRYPWPTVERWGVRAWKLRDMRCPWCQWTEVIPDRSRGAYQRLRSVFLSRGIPPWERLDVGKQLWLGAPAHLASPPGRGAHCIAMGGATF